ncbi:MAG: hypothetical protein ACM3O7_05395 [Acidobacteriota bacterium]
MKRARFAVLIAVVAGVLLARPVLAGITIEEFVLADGSRAFALGGRLFLLGAEGVLRSAGDGTFSLKSGGQFSVRSGRLVVPPRKLGEFDPQPEPPGYALRSALAGGGEVVLVRGQLFLLEGSARRLLPDGSYKLRGGVRAEVARGALRRLTSLEGFVPAQAGNLAPRR